MKSTSGYRARLTVYKCEDCSGCPHKSKCTKAERRIKVSKTFIEKRQKSYKNIMTDKGVKLRVNRSILVEASFLVLKNGYEFNQFLTRGKIK